MSRLHTYHIHIAINGYKYHVYTDIVVGLYRGLEIASPHYSLLIRNWCINNFCNSIAGAYDHDGLGTRSQSWRSHISYCQSFCDLIK